MVSWALAGPPPPLLTSRLAVVITGWKLAQVQLNDLTCTHTESTVCRVDIYVKVSNEIPTRSDPIYICVVTVGSGLVWQSY
jgi:hypothetical protein